MRSYKFILAIVLLPGLFILHQITPVASAQTGNSNSQKETMMEKRDATKQEAMDKKAQIMEQVQTQRTEAKNAMMEQKEEMMQKRENLRLMIQEKKASLAAELRAKRQELRNNLTLLRDERKKTIAERIDSNLTTINTRHTDRMATVIEKLQEILDRISEKTAEYETEGVDVSPVNAAIASAQTAIDAAKNAISTQAAKEYIADVNGSESLGNAFSTVVNQLRADLRATHLTLIEAKKAVRNAATELVKLKSAQGEEDDEASGSADLES